MKIIFSGIAVLGHRSSIRRQWRDLDLSIRSPRTECFRHSIYPILNTNDLFIGRNVEGSTINSTIERRLQWSITFVTITSGLFLLFSVSDYRVDVIFCIIWMMNELYMLRYYIYYCLSSIYVTHRFHRYCVMLVYLLNDVAILWLLMDIFE